MADIIAKKLAKDQLRGQATKRVIHPHTNSLSQRLTSVQGGYVFGAPERNERGKKLNKSEKFRWEVERYSDPRWAIPERDLKVLMVVKKRAKQLDA